MSRVPLFALALLLLAAAPARADIWGDGVAVMADADMAEQRGGFELGGVVFSFGAVVTTLINGAPALETTLTLDDTGSVVSQTLGQVGQNLADMTPAQLNALGLGGLGSGAGGVVVSDASGVTALVHNVTEGALQNIIINNASGRDLTQNVDVSITLPAFEQLQHDIGTQLFGMRIGNDLNNSLTAAPR